MFGKRMSNASFSLDDRANDVDHQYLDEQQHADASIRISICAQWSDAQTYTAASRAADQQATIVHSGQSSQANAYSTGTAINE